MVLGSLIGAFGFAQKIGFDPRPSADPAAPSLFAAEIRILDREGVTSIAMSSLG